MVRKSFTTTIDDELQDIFKSKCGENGDKMNDVLEAFMEEYISGSFTVEKKVKYVLKKKDK